MKNLIVLVAMITSLGIKAEIVCEKKGRFWYPKNEKALMIAKSLRVKTCNGERFKEVVSKLGETSNIKSKPKQLSVDELVAKLKK